MPIYLDFNATTPVDSRVLDEMINVYRNYYGNAGSRTHVFGQRANEIVNNARSKIATLLNIDKSEIVFTSGATESNNIAILGLAHWGSQHGRKHIISTQIEHKSVLEPLKYLSKNGFEIDLIGVNTSGRINADEVLSKLKPETLLVSIMHVNNESGIIQPVLEIGEALSKTEIFFHVDAAQSCGKLVNELKQMKYDILSITAHKMYGPQGIGALVLRYKNYSRPPVKPIMFGGNHESGLRPGTLPVALIAGFGFAAVLAEHEYANNLDLYKSIKIDIINQLNMAKINYVINGDQKYCIPNTLNISFPGVESEALMLSIKDTFGISNGSACTSYDYSHSHVLTAMGLKEELIESAIRLSWGTQKVTTKFSTIIDSIKSLLDW